MLKSIYKKWWPLEDIEARDLKFWIEPFTTHTVLKTGLIWEQKNILVCPWMDIMLFFLFLIGMDNIIPQISSSRKKHDDYLFIHYLHQIN